MLAPTYLPWTIRNKYYEADVHFCIQGAEAWAPDETTRAMGAAEAPAVIVLAEATRVGPLSHALRLELRRRNRVRDRAKDTNACTTSVQVPAEPTVSGLANLAAAEPRPDVCLLVTLRRPPSSRGLSHEQVPSGDEWEDLALEHGFEWVQVDAVDAGAEQERDDEAEQDGIAQVSAALHAHMWEGLRRRDAREDPISLQAGAAEESDEDGQDSLLPPPSLPRGECHPSRVETEPRLASLPKTRPHSADLDPNIWSFPSTFLPLFPEHASMPLRQSSPQMTAARPPLTTISRLSCPVRRLRRSLRHERVAPSPASLPVRPRRQEGSTDCQAETISRHYWRESVWRGRKPRAWIWTPGDSLRRGWYETC